MKTKPEFEEGQKVWISKWATSGRIVTATFVQQSWANVPWLFDLLCDGEEEARAFWRKEFHATEREAVNDANARLDKRVKSLRKQIEKLEAMRFTAKEEEEVSNG